MPPAEVVCPAGSSLEVLLVFFKLGLTSFGGPVAHLAYFRLELVERRLWLDEGSYADTVALCQLLPGPSSSQVAVCLGTQRAGMAGGLAAWIGFCMPSAVLMILFAYGVGYLEAVSPTGWQHGLKIVAVAVVAQAVFSMASKLCPDRLRKSLAVLSALLCLGVPSAAGQFGAIVVGGLIGWRWLGGAMPEPGFSGPVPISKGLSMVALVLGFLFLLASLQPLNHSEQNGWNLAAAFYRTGSLVFGGGHVVLPLLQQAVCAPGWIGTDRFLAGYGAAQALPGPLFSLAAYLGAISGFFPSAWVGGMACLMAIYLPTFLLLIGVLPHWNRLRRQPGVQFALKGVNAAVVGLLLAALYTPVWTSAILSAGDFGAALLAFGALTFGKAPAWLVVFTGAVLGHLICGPG